MLKKIFNLNNANNKKKFPPFCDNLQKNSLKIVYNFFKYK